MGTDLSIVNAARVSFAKESDWEYPAIQDMAAEPFLKESDERLINYLAKHQHYSPFNHTFLTFRIKAPIYVARQLQKHEYMPWNEVSRRYVDDEPEFYMPVTWRAVADSVKQGSDMEKSIVMMKHTDPNLNTSWFSDVNQSVFQYTEHCLSMYSDMLSAGIAPELARSVLPQSTMTEWIWSGTLKAFHKMLSLRLDSHTQYETRIVAQKILPLIEQHFPISISALLSA